MLLRISFMILHLKITCGNLPTNWSTLMTDLSPAAKAVDDAFWKTINDKWNIYDRRRAQLAAALRAVVQELKYFGITEKNILAIATELEETQ